MGAPTLVHLQTKFDGSVKGSSATADIIIRAHNGSLLHATTFNLGEAKFFVSEATILHRGIKIALQKGINNIIIELKKISWSLMRLIVLGRPH